MQVTEARASVAPGVCLDALQKFPIDFKNFPMEGSAICKLKMAVPFQHDQKENSGSEKG